VQTANPDFYGGDRVDLLFGVNMIGQRGVICGHRLAAEFGVPVYQQPQRPAAGDGLDLHARVAEDARRLLSTT
jgi:hypothetical protein